MSIAKVSKVAAGYAADRASGVARAGAAAVQWSGNVSATRIHKYSQSQQPLTSASRVKFGASEFGIPGNLAFKLQIYAPGVTDTWWDKAGAIQHLDLHIESPFISGGKLPVTYVGQAGFGDHDFVVQARVSEMVIGGSPASGSYPVRFMAGSRELARFTLDWVK